MNVRDFLRVGGQGILLRVRLFVLLLAWLCVQVPGANGQETERTAPQASGSARPTSQPSGSGRPAASARPGSSRPDGKPADGTEDGEKKGDSDDGSKVIDRPLEPAAPPDPTELKVRPDDDGKLAFNFRNQPWVSLLEWFAEIADQPLDWRQLPGDHVNLASSGRYTLDEVFDLLNRHLLARGFTMVQLDDGLMVLKTEGINPALVPRVAAERLATLQPHQFVRASMDAGWLSAEELAEELNPMISSNGRLVAMKSTNRIETMDAATNLRQIFELLQQELSADARDHLAPEFELRYISAEDAKKMLEQFLGIEKKESPPLTPQQQQQLRQQQSRSSSSSGQQPPTEEKKPEISIVANSRRNSVLIQAPADRLAIAQQFIKRIDVPSDSIVSLADVENRVQAFRLVSLDPEKLIEIVQDMNILEPSTRIRVDSDSSAVIVSGGAADRFIIKSLIERLDGSGREFYVLPVRYRDPRAVAESISFLMGKDKKKDESRSRSPYYSYFGSSRQEEKKQDDEFRVTADVQFRQVLVWANEIELAEVRSLLVKLGEIPPEEGSRRAVRVLDAAPTPETYEYLKRLKQQFQQIAPNEIELPPLDLFKDPNRRPQKKDETSGSATEDENGADVQEEADDNGGKQELPAVKEDPLARRSPGRGAFFTAAMQTETAPPAGEQATESDGESGVDPSEIDPRTIRSAEDFDRLFGDRDGTNRAVDRRSSVNAGSENEPPAPLQFSIGPDGRIVVRSTDTDALDRLEDLMLQLTPPKRPYRVFYIEHASALWVQLNLEDYFSDEDKTEDDSRGRRYYFYDYQRDDDSDDAMGLDQQRKMRMVSDPDTNTIVVTGATPEQLRTIEELIELWDVPEPVDKRKVRYTKLVPVRYSRAEKIAETVKEAYRDLLSSNDKTFTQGNRGSGGGGGGGQSTQRNQAERSRDGGGSELVDEGRGGQSGGSNFDFKGKLAIGVDDIGNSLLVTAEGEELLKLVVGMIEQLDTSAQPQGDVQVHKVSGSINATALEAALRVLSSEAAPATPQSPPRSPEPSRRGRSERGGGDVGNGAD